MAGKRTYRKRKAAPKSKWARKRSTRSSRSSKPKRTLLNKKQKSIFYNLMAGGSLDESEE